MSEQSPNDQQRALINSIDGVHVVDAGAGTGKTFAITRRYANIFDETGASPQDILLVTFTRAAAAEMRERIVDRTDYDMTQLQHAPIGTFHAHALRLLRRYGHDAPQHLDIDDYLSHSLDIVEDAVRERSLFREFVTQFADDHPEYTRYLALLQDRGSLASLLSQLAAKGVVPTGEGWYRNTGEILRGDRADFFDVFDDVNTPGDGRYGPTNSDARSSVSQWESLGYTSDAPTADELHDDPTIDRDWVELAFDEDRTDLVAFVHDVYYDYLRFLIDRGVLTQSFVLILAFVLLCEDETVRKSVSHDYTMIDEFQDTNEIQFKLALLLSRTNNICVVGDWKQSIYGFQYTSIENIRSFESRIRRYRDELNADQRRITYDVSSIKSIPLRKNYRSTASILDRAESTLQLPASRSESVPDLDIQSLNPTNFIDNSRIEKYTAEDEYDLVLDRIQHVVGDDDYAVEVADEPNPGSDASVDKQAAAERERLGPPSYDDIAVLTRKRDFARELLRRADDLGIPVAYQGGLEIFDTPEAKLILAWLRICETDDDRGWAVALERAGYPLADAKRVLAERDYPEPMVEFRETLRATAGIGGFSQKVLERYGRDSIVGDALVNHLATTYQESLVTRGELIEEMVLKLEAGSKVEIDTNPGNEAITLQTIHSVKGLEYPIVFVSNVNYRAFPNYGRGPDSPIVYDEQLGLRQRKRYIETDGRPYVYGHWQYDLLSSVLPSSYDEERRLFYVAATRAKRHLLLTAGETPSTFFDRFPVEAETIDSCPTRQETVEEETESFNVPTVETSERYRTGVHDIMDDSVYEAGSGGRGAEFGQAVHDFAEAYVDNPSIKPDNPDQDAVAEFVDGLEGTMHPEQLVLFPVETDPAVTLTGIVDLLNINTEKVHIVDWKTDTSRRAHDEYRLQLSVYYHVLNHVYPDRDVLPIVFYTHDGDAVDIDPVDTSSIKQRVRDYVL